MMTNGRPMPSIDEQMAYGEAEEVLAKLGGALRAVEGLVASGLEDVTGSNLSFLLGCIADLAEDAERKFGRACTGGPA